MFIGHFALGFAARRAAPRLPLGAAFLAAQLPDAIWPVLVLTGVEKVAIAPGDTAFTPLRFESYPISHSLLTVAAWSALLGILYAVWLKDRRAGLVAFGLGVSHWLLDFASHRPDLPLVPGGGARFGLGLWNSVPATLLVETLLFAAGAWLYWKASVSRSGRGRVALGVLACSLFLIHLGNAFGPPPPSVTAVGVVSLLAVPLAWFWGNWVDRRTAAA